jgi:hypothetical protein
MKEKIKSALELLVKPGFKDLVTGFYFDVLLVGLLKLIMGK